MDNKDLETLRDENARLHQYIDRIVEDYRGRESRSHRTYIISVAAAMFSGFAITFVSAPSIKEKSDCGIPKVDYKTVTSFVLKPPPSPEAEPKSCPVAPKCESQTVETPESNKAETANVDETKSRHHRRHHRTRAYWK